MGLLMAGVALCGLARAGDTRPNIVYILSDDAGYNEFGFTAALNGTTTAYETPNLDALAAQSKVLAQAYAEPVCSPTRAALLTGQVLQRFGYEDNIDAGLTSTQGLRGDQQTIGDYLQGLGYTTGVIGKWHVGSLDGVNRPQDQGFDEFYGLLDGSRTYWPNTGIATKQHILRGDVDIESTWGTQGDTSRYDPAGGRYLTDAIGEESADFINRHASDADPFFLYMSLTGVHSPDQAKQSDRDHFPGISDPTLATRAAMAYAVDRSVGDVLQALKNNGVDEDTIVIFANDNGGEGSRDNTPFQGRKGYIFEGGIRVPALIRAPGINPGVFEAPVTLRDFVPTLVAAAGGNPGDIDVDGIDLMPHLNSNTTQVHDLLFHRAGSGAWAVRKGDWKLTSPAGEWGGNYGLFNPRLDPGETTDLQAQQPELVAELLIELGKWEATIEKPSAGSLGAVRNTFDHFKLDTTIASQTFYWHVPSIWKNPSGEVVTMRRDDLYANAILEFPVRDSAGYATVNSAGRLTWQASMLNQLRFTGDFGGAANLSGRITGKALLFVDSLDGLSPMIMVDATSHVGSYSFSFSIESQIQLMNDLVITGDGTQPLYIRGGIVDFDEPRSITKAGKSTVLLRGSNTFAGDLRVLDGELRFELSATNVEKVRTLEIGSQGKLVVPFGRLAAEQVDNSHGGILSFTGGRLSFNEFRGPLLNQGGTVAPNRSIGEAMLDGTYTQTTTGTLEIELGAAGSDKLVASGGVSLAGKLDVVRTGGYQPVPGSLIGVVFAPTIGTAGLSLAAEDAGMFQLIQFADTSGATLFLRALGGVPGDYNLNGIVDAADYTVWRNGFGRVVPQWSGGDGDGDGQITTSDYGVWKSHFGMTVASVGAGAGSVASVPEPSALAFVALAGLGLMFGAGRRGNLTRARHS